MRTIPIFFTFDNNYVVPAAVAFYSLLDNAKSDVYYKMYVLHSDISIQNQELLQDVVKKKNNGELTFININNSFDEFWKNGSFVFTKNGAFTADAIVRCFGARYFPQYDKIIYSDVDIIVVDDISEIYDMDMQGSYIAGVKNCFAKYSSFELSHLKPEHYAMLSDKYIGGGIWVMNLKKIREDDIETKMVDVIKDETIVKRWNDQDIVNIACNGKVSFLPLNYISYPYLIDLLKKSDFVSDYSREELYDSILHPKIIHFAADKPWNRNPNYSSLWYTYFYYLNLKETSIFNKETWHKKKKFSKKILLLCVCVASLVLNGALILKMFLAG